MLGPMIGLWTTVLSLSVAAIASPVQVARREISSNLLDRFTLFSQFASVAACEQNINATGQKLTCDFDACGLVEAEDTVVTHTFRSNGPTGYIALDHTQKQIILAFRKTVSGDDGITDINIAFVPIDNICTGCRVHGGFWKYWTDVADQVTLQLRKVTELYPSYDLNIVGHSLGAAIATVAGTVLRRTGFTLDIWTFGGPRVGNYRLADFITNQKTPNSIYRATHASDKIPQVPISLFRDWSQPSPEYWINQKGIEQVTPSMVEYIQGINNQSGNAGTDTSFMWPNPEHGWYFGNMTVCVPPSDASNR